VKDVLGEGFEVKFVKSNDSFVSVLKRLSEWKVSSAPVWNDGKKEFVGLIDMADLVATVSTVIEAKVEAMEKTTLTWDDRDIMAKQTIEELMDFSEQNPFQTVMDSDPLTYVLNMFSSNTDLHRVAVFNSEDKLVGLLTQSRMLEFIYQNKHRWNSEIAKKTMKVVKPLDFTNVALSSFRDPVEKCLLTDPTWQAYRKISHKEISALAVTNNSGVLMGCLSVSDLKRSGDDFLKDMYLPVGEYIRKSRPTEGGISCTDAASIDEAIRWTISNKVHRIFVVDDQSKPLRVISLCDFISLFSVDTMMMG
jgi:CBS-domain-containing membrane protein